MKFSFSYCIFVVFALLEVLLFERPPLLQISFSVVQYCFIAVQVVRRPVEGIYYFAGFTLLAMGGWTYIVVEQQPYTFWGLRLFGLSVNLLFSILLFSYLLLRRDVSLRSVWQGWGNRFFAVMVGYCLLAGIPRVALGSNYLDNLVGDLAVFAPLILYIPMVLRLGEESVRQLIAHGVSASVVAMGFSAVVGRSFNYGDDYRFALVSGFGYVSVFLVPFMYRQLGKVHYAMLMGIIVALVGSGRLFIGGKTIIVAMVAMVWALFYAKRAVLTGILVGGILALVSDVFVTFTAKFMEEGSLTAYKYSQASEVFEANSLAELSTRKSSIGNLAAEALTIWEDAKEEPLWGVFGRGFGAGIRDHLGLLSPAAGPGAGYRIEDAIRDNFMKMHLPIFNVATRTGVLGMIAFCALLFFYLQCRNPAGLVSFVILATVMTNSKEMALLCVVFMYAAETEWARRSQIEVKPKTSAPPLAKGKRWLGPSRAPYVLG